MSYLPGPLIAALLGVPAGTLRRWAARGHIRRRGTGANGVALYDLHAVADYARSRGRTKVATRHGDKVA